MATTLYLKSSLAQISRGTNTNDQRGNAKDWRAYALSTTVGTGAGSSVTSTSVAGPIAGLEFIATGSVLAEWISEPLAAAVTISGTISYRFCGSESNTMANGSASFLVQRLDSTGAIASTVATASHGTELSATQAAHAFTATPTSTAFSKGDRIRIVAFVDDNATTTNMASNFTFTLNFDGAAASTADTYVQFTENLTWASVLNETKLVASDKISNDQFGYSVACSSDGLVIAVGAQLSDPGGTSGAGAVYVYSGSNYATEKKLVASDKAASDNFGYSVACSSDGSVIAVGAPLSDPGGTNSAGAVYVYSGSNYATEKKLVASDKAASDQFGYSVACSSDGSVIAVGAPFANPGGTIDAGAVYVYSGSNYATETKLVASDKVSSDLFGRSVSCSSDGSIVVVGAFLADPGATNDAGAVYVYSGTNYATETKLVASDKVISDNFGSSVSCSSDGSIVVVGAYLANPGGTADAGAVYVYSGSNYATETKLVASDKVGSDSFGRSVACSSDGSIVVVGAFLANPGGTADAGAVYVYSGSNYATETKLVASDKVAGDNFGYSVDCSSDGSVIAVGAQLSDPGGSNAAGAAYVYPDRRYYLTATASDIADQSTDEKKVWTSR